ncbi:MAG TPA: LptF/LptG family permease [Tepidisphaeraceae bacterium]
MSPTLFKYVFKNLIGVFLLASGVIANIMSFGGLLRPLTETGLDLGQIGKMLAYATPAMTTYSFPIAALFATTVVYGRLASDNEVTAVRAAGISLGPLGLGLPALVLGLIVSFVSLAFLSFLVPAATLKVERTVVSNIGQFIVNRIEQQHQVRLQQTGAQPLTISARTARLEPQKPGDKDQVVTLEGVSIVTFDKSDDDSKLQVPAEFYVAESATAYIRQPEDDQGQEMPVQLKARLTNGVKFPRSVIGRETSAIQGGIRAVEFGPFELRSPLRENTKFMDFRRLNELRANPEKSRRMSEALSDVIRVDQQNEYLKSVYEQLRRGGEATFTTPEGDVYKLRPGRGTTAIERNRLVLTGDSEGPGAVRLQQTRRNGQSSIDSEMREARLRVLPENDDDRLAINIELIDAVVLINGEKAVRDTFERPFSVVMPPAIAAIRQRGVNEYLGRPDVSADQRRMLARNKIKQDNSIISEMHSRISFAISCLVLTLVGYGLGVLFKSGNYLTAFAVSVVPALLSIVLVVTGQHICENVPTNIGANFKNPVQLGLIVIWTGNAIVLVIAVGLLQRLRRM